MVAQYRSTGAGGPIDRVTMPGGINFPHLADSPTPPSPYDSPTSSSIAPRPQHHHTAVADLRHRFPPSPGESSSTSSRRQLPFVSAPPASFEPPPPIMRRRLRQRRSLDRKFAVDLADDFGDDTSATSGTSRQLRRGVDDLDAARRSAGRTRRPAPPPRIADGRAMSASALTDEALSRLTTMSGAAADSDDEDDDDWC